MGKKSKRIKKPQEVYTKDEKIEQITTLKSKIEQLSLDALFPETIDTLYKNMDNYITNNVEYYYEEKLESAKRSLHVCLKNKKRYPISVYMPHNMNDK